MQGAIELGEDAAGNDLLRQALKQLLQEMREVLHRSGRISSRHEALDDISKLLFAHVMSIDAGGRGICRSILEADRRPGASLRAFVAAAFEAHLPASLSHDLRP